MVQLTGLETALVALSAAFIGVLVTMLWNRDTMKRADFDGLRDRVGELESHMQILLPLVEEAKQEATKYLREKYGGKGQ